MNVASVVGVDACKTGWIAVVLGDGGLDAHHLPTIADIGELAADAAGIAIDIPIGVPDAAAPGPRRCDVAARAALGPRRSSLFLTPVRAALVAPTHALACAASVAAGSRGVSQQAWRLGPKILEVEAWLSRAPCPVWEVHPELAFSLLIGRPAGAPKKTWAGMQQRRHALLAAGIDVDRIDPASAAARAAAPDDMLDAAACAWSARRLVAGEGRCFPDAPPVDRAGRPVAIWA